MSVCACFVLSCVHTRGFSLFICRPDHNLQDIRAKFFPLKRRKVEAPEVTPTNSLPVKRKERSLSSLVVSTPKVLIQLWGVILITLTLILNGIAYNKMRCQLATYIYTFAQTFFSPLSYYWFGSFQENWRCQFFFCFISSLYIPVVPLCLLSAF